MYTYVAKLLHSQLFCFKNLFDFYILTSVTLFYSSLKSITVSSIINVVICENRSIRRNKISVFQLSGEGS